MLLVTTPLMAGAQESTLAPAWASDWQLLAADCASSERVEVHRIDDATYLLRQPLCVSVEAPVMVLLVGADRALLIDSGDDVDRSKALVDKVIQLLPAPGGERLPLVVAHTHGHLDHRSGDGAFRRFAHTTVVGSGAQEVAAFWGLREWPEGLARLDLGGRVVEVVAIPGHHPSSIALFDVATGLLISGDSLLPGRVIINDLDAFRASVRRLKRFADARVVSWVVGAHVETDVEGSLYRSGAGAHPDEHAAVLPAESITELSAAIDDFGAFAIRSRHDSFVLVHQKRLLMVIGGGLVLGVVFVFRRRPRMRFGRESRSKPVRHATPPI
jgi:glyoxylase-like metal-dependent hydrolase (beta-lactamase superfamily II)